MLCNCKGGPPPQTLLMDDTDFLTEQRGCDFCGNGLVPSVERIGDKVACAECVKEDEGVCECCGHPLRVLDEGGTETENGVVCERCWVHC